MTTTTVLNRNLHALLVGIDCYLPNRLPDGGFYPSLGGCVRDITQVEAFLTKTLALPPAQIIKLTASIGKTDEPTEPKDQWPTYGNLVAAFQEITRRAQPGDQVYIHYSGHGGRSVTAFPELKGVAGLDESLVPTDIGDSEARYVRDVELAHLLKQLVDKQIVVTIVLDSCHSGGATRGFGGGAVRGISSIDTSQRPTDSLVATRAELIETWQTLQPGQSRNAKIAGTWIPEVQGALLLAACRANELANETLFEGDGRNGALTYWMLDSLKQLSPELTFKMLHDRVLAKIHATFKNQTPQLHGDGARVVFDTNRAPSPPSVRVLEVDQLNRRLKVEAGEAQGIGAGARFAIYPSNARTFTPAEQLALVEIREAQPAASWAEIIEAQNYAGLTEGAQAVLIDSGSVRLRGRVRLTEQKEGLPPDIDQAAALNAVATEIGKSSWIRLANATEETDYQLVVNANHEYEVWDQSGHLIPNLRPAVRIDDPAAPATLARQLVHLTKFRNVKLIDNSASTSPLARQFSVELLGETVAGSSGIPVLDVGESAVLRVKNSSSKVLNITIFDLQPDWGVKQVYPADSDSEILDPGAALDLPLTDVSLPRGYAEGLDTIKVFATVESTSFRWLELPVLDQPVMRSIVVTKAPSSPLEQLMAAFASEAPPKNMRSFNLGAAPVSSWTTGQIDFRVRRPAPALRHVRDPQISLLQAAFDEVATEKAQQRRMRGEAGSSASTVRASVTDPLFNAMTDSLLNPEDTQRGVGDNVKYCAGLAKAMASEFWNAFHRGDREKYDAYKAGLTVKFGDCDPNFTDGLTKYLEFLWHSGKVPYQPAQQLSDSVFEDKLPTNATISLVADWGTGQPEALEVLRQVKRNNPQVVIHLGDIYYAGTATEVENYFARPWREILQPESSGIASFALPGNHDMYSGGQGYYDLIKALGQHTSYFCLRNADWQFIGLDTALNDRINGPPTSLDPTEVTWLKDKIDSAGQRRTVLLTHHQLFSTSERFDDKSYNENLYQQVKDFLPQVKLWLWGHEHDLVVFNEFMGVKRARCIGGSAFPVGKYEMPAVPQNADVPFNKEVMLSKGAAFYQHCYCLIKLEGPKATVSYCEDRDGGRVLFTETIE